MEREELLLCDLSPGERAVVMKLNDNTRLRRRLQDLGIVVGAQIDCVLKSPLGNPVAYRANEMVFALRRNDAAAVMIEKEI